MPARFLRGLLPDALVDDYVFWQERENYLVGYLRRDIDERVMTKTRIKVDIVKV